MEDLHRILEEHPFLKGLDKKHLQLITGCASNVRFEEGQYIFREGEEANYFYIVRHGTVSLELYVPQKGPVGVQTLAEGEILGWSWLIPPYKWMFDARAVELTRAIALDGKCLRNKCEEDHDMGYELLKRFSHEMGERLVATRLQLLDMFKTGE